MANKMRFGQQARKGAKQFEEREHLLDVLKKENAYISAAVEELYSHEGQDDAASIKYCKSVLESVKRITEAGDWQTSLFLRNLIKPITEMGEDANHVLEDLTGERDEIAEKKQELKEDEILLYVSLFQTKGHDTVIWESQLRAIERNIIGRPVYKDLDNVKKIIRLKANPMNEAYAVIKVDKNLIQKPNAFDVERKDRYGNSLETLKPGAVMPDDIIEFVHDNCTYSFSKGHLKLQSGGSDE